MPSMLPPFTLVSTRPTSVGVSWCKKTDNPGTLTPALPPYPQCSLSFHMAFYRLLKWLIAGPFLMCALALLTVQVGPALPS